MRILYLDLGMGAAGDMLAGALLELLPETEREAFLARLNALLPEGVTVRAEAAQQCGVCGTHFDVRVHGEEELSGGLPHGHDHHHDHDHDRHHDHAHAGLTEIAAVVEGMGLEPPAAEDVMAVYRAIAGAEARVHGAPVEQVHFHELGALDAVADITAVTLLLRAIAPDRIVASPVAVGSGTVRCAHGVLPVPAPATALLLRGIPVLPGEGEGEKCTPTGAALIGRWAADFGTMPAMTPERFGYGFGTKEFPGRPNCVRAVLGESGAAGAAETVLQLQCNLDDMTPEDVGYALERIYAAGAVEAFTVAAGMKKNRPGVLLTALCRPAEREAVLAAIFAHTGTLGVREAELKRYALQREIETVETALGPVRRKLSRGYGTEKRKWEFDDLAGIAREKGLPISAVREALERDGN